jgi:hypothetical protein
MRRTRETPTQPEQVKERSPRDDDVILIEDLAPPSNVKGGRKILLGEILTPLSNPQVLPGS